MIKTIQQIQNHDHTCLIFENEIEFFHCAIPFIKDGINKNEQCMIVVDEIKREEVLSKFKFLYRDGTNPFDELNKGKIVIKHFKDIYLPDGVFSIKRTAETYMSFVREALSNGYSALRVFAEVSTLVRNTIKEHDFWVWEETACKYFPDNNFIAVCAYNKKYFSKDFILKTKAIHPIEIDLIATRL